MRQQGLSIALAGLVGLALPAALPARQGDPAAEIQKLFRVGEALLDGGKPAEALRTLEAALAKAETVHGKEHVQTAMALILLGRAHEGLGQFARAEALYRRSLAIREARLGKDHAHVGACLRRLAEVHRKTRRYAAAEPLYRRAIVIVGVKLGTNDPIFGYCLNDLALCYVDQGQYAKAEPFYKRSLEIHEARLGKDHPEVAISLNNLALVYANTGQHAKAEELLRRSVQIREARQGAYHPGVALALNNLAPVLEAMGRPGEAERLFDRARRISRHHVRHVLPALPPAEQAAFLAANERFQLAKALSAALRPGGGAALAERSAGWLLNGKAVAEEALAQATLLARDGRDPASDKVAAQLREVHKELASLSLAAPPPGQEKAHRERLDQLRRQEAGLTHRLAGRPGGAGGWAEPAALRKSLPAGGVFLDVCRFAVYDFNAAAGKHWQRARYAAWVTPQQGDAHLVDLGDAAAIDAAVLAVRKALEQSAQLIRAAGEPQAEKALRGPLERLSGLVLQPLLPYAGGSARLVVSPDGALWLIPWEILLLPDGKYAVERHTFSYAVSGRDLLSASPYKGRPGAPVIVADPDFDYNRNTGRTEAPRRPATAEGAKEPTRGLSGLLGLGSIPRLKGARGEAKAIEKPLAAYAKQEPVQRLGKEAQEGVVKATKNPRVLVLSTHGFFLANGRIKPSERPGEKAALPPGWENPLLRCGLLLAGCNHAGKVGAGDDGVLTGLEVVGMDLRGCEMVVLSACETGLGDLQQGEGMAGLRQAFRLAGAESVVSTLWQVPDQQSARLMTLFFHGLPRGRGRAAALREAQLKVIEERREDSGAAHPFFWAAFTLTGW